MKPFLSCLLQNEARETIPRMLVELNLGRTEKCVRVNSVSSGLAEADLQVILQGEVLPPAVMLPKVEDTQEVQWVRMYLFYCFRSLVIDKKEIKRPNTRQTNSWNTCKNWTTENTHGISVFGSQSVLKKTQ